MTSQVLEWREPGTSVDSATILLSDHPTCSLCHTASAELTRAALEAGGAWRCVTCGQHWDAERVETVAAAAVWAQAHPARPRGWLLDIYAPVGRAT